MTRPRPRRREPDTIADQLRSAIRSSDMTAYELGRLAVLDRGQILRFLDGGGDLLLESAARVAIVLGLELGPARAPRPRPARPRRARRPAATPAGGDGPGRGDESGVTG